MGVEEVWELLVAQAKEGNPVAAVSILHWVEAAAGPTAVEALVAGRVAGSDVAMKEVVPQVGA